MEIDFEIRKDKSLSWNGRAYPNVSSGCAFGGCGETDIKEVIEKEKKWLEESYERRVIPKKK